MHLIGHIGTNIGSEHLSAHRTSRADSSQTSNTHADHVDLRRIHPTRCGNGTGELATEGIRGFDDRTVASNVHERRAHIERLRTRDTWNCIERKRRDLALCAHFEQFSVVLWIEARKERGTFLHKSKLLERRRIETDDDIGCPRFSGAH